MRKFLMVGAAAAALSATQAAFAETPVGADKQTAIAVTIYNNDLALVRDSRTVTLTPGRERPRLHRGQRRHPAGDRVADRPRHARSTSSSRISISTC